MKSGLRLLSDVKDNFRTEHPSLRTNMDRSSQLKQSSTHLRMFGRSFSSDDRLNTVNANTECQTVFDLACRKNKPDVLSLRNCLTPRTVPGSRCAPFPADTKSTSTYSLLNDDVGFENLGARNSSSGPISFATLTKNVSSASITTSDNSAIVVNCASNDTLWDGSSMNIQTENVVSSRTVEKKNRLKVSPVAFETFQQCVSVETSKVHSKSVVQSDRAVRFNVYCHGCRQCSTPQIVCDRTSRKRDKRRQKDRPQRCGKKWKQVRDEMLLGFRITLLPRFFKTTSDAEEVDIQKELEAFQNISQSCEETFVTSEDEPKNSNQPTEQVVENFNGEQTRVEPVESLTPSGSYEAAEEGSYNINSSLPKSSSDQIIHTILPQVINSGSFKPRDATFFIDSNHFETVSFYEEKISHRILSAFETAETGRLRTKKKWKERKAHVQIKTKHCMSLSNSVHGQKFYFHHRVLKRMQMEIQTQPSKVLVSMKRIDKCKGLGTELVEKIVKHCRHSGSRREAREGHNVQTPWFAVNAYNADGDMSVDLVNLMITLQHRDLLPEDYDLLLRLDDRVKPKTIDAAVLTGLKTEVVVSPGDELCAVCLEPYEVGQTKKYLACQHCFHETCIDSWLSNSSVNCPLDGTPVFGT